ncbi:MAG: single-stranded DNA-binding protein [Nitrospirota bacterium]|jgi:single-strand DNA-binding protein|nr:single-stranded DNA-binding protein [Nitrospirota bacterium]
MLNKALIIGNLTRMPELRYTPNGTPVTTLGVATSRKYRQGEELKEDVCFVDVVVFGKQAEHCGQYLIKGSGVIIDGRLQQRRWETEDGQKRSKHEIVAQTITFMPKREGQHTDVAHEEVPEELGTHDDVPDEVPA